MQKYTRLSHESSGNYVHTHCFKDFMKLHLDSYSFVKNFTMFSRFLYIIKNEMLKCFSWNGKDRIIQQRLHKDLATATPPRNKLICPNNWGALSSNN